MKKTIIIVTIFMILIGIFLCINKTYAAEKAIDNETESKIIEIKEKFGKNAIFINKNMDQMLMDL